ncbi:MAG: hypothetical protein ACJAQ9_002577 [Ilumatobacter sp.]
MKQELAVFSTDAVASHLLDSVVATFGADAVRPLAHTYCRAQASKATTQ